MTAPVNAWAQRGVWSAELGTARMRFADSIDATALSITPSWRLRRVQSSIDASATLSHLDGAWSNSASFDGVVSTDRQRMLSWEAEGVAGGSAHSDGSRTAQLLAFGRGHVALLSGGAWLGAGFGAAFDAAWRDVRQLDIGGWTSLDAADFVARLSPTAVDDTIRYTDITFSAHRMDAAWELDASFGLRAGDPIPTLPANRKAWGHLSAALWLTPRVAVVASAGSYPVDFTQGYPGGRYVSLSLRLRSRPNLELRVAPPVPDGLREFRSERLAPGRYRIRVRVQSATSVELAGDFTQWEPVTLARESDQWWSMTIDLSDGSYEVAVRANGGSWQAPPGLTPMTDEFGGRSGLLIVPQ